MKGRVLLPPLMLSFAACAVAGVILGGSPWVWVIAGWLLAAPLTLVWARVMDAPILSRSEDDAAEMGRVSDRPQADR